MKIFSINESPEKNCLMKIYSFLGMPFMRVETTLSRRRVYLLGVRVISLKWKSFRCSARDVVKKINLIKDSSITCWFDHMLGGGTDVYSVAAFKAYINKKEQVLRIQSIANKKEVFITFYGGDNNFSSFSLDSFDEVKEILSLIKFKRIVINNIVGYANSLNVLDDVINCKKNSTVSVRFNVHDFHCVCPSFNLVDCSGRFCGLNLKKCRECFPLIRLGNNKAEHEILISGANDILKWRELWKRFLSKYCDEIFAFSDSSKNILLKVYPELEEKVRVIPHEVPEIKPARVKMHQGIRVAFLGNISSVSKGRDVIKKLADVADNHNIEFFVIGECANVSDKVKVTGRYKINDLTSIVETLEIDMIIIPSIWAETFSYTTSEAINLQLPVACFDYGAQAEKVKKYSKGLILPSEEPKEIIQKIEKYFLAA